jgi:hypothetical protein
MCIGEDSRRHEDKRGPPMNTDEHRLPNRSSWALAISPRMTGRGDALGVGSCFHCSYPFEFRKKRCWDERKVLWGKRLGALLFFLTAGMAFEATRRFCWGCGRGSTCPSGDRGLPQPERTDRVVGGDGFRKRLEKDLAQMRRRQKFGRKQEGSRQLRSASWELGFGTPVCAEISDVPFFCLVFFCLFP